MLRRGTHHDEALEYHAWQHRALSPRGEPVRSPAPSSFFVLFHGRARWCVDVSSAGNRGRGGMTGSVTGIRRRRTVAGRRETSHLPPDRAFYGQTLCNNHTGFLAFRMFSAVCCGVWLELSNQKPIRGVVWFFITKLHLYYTQGKIICQGV